mgnify:CR=1 FL=1
MIRRLKVVLGPEAYASFRRAARASQLGKVAIPDYFAYVARVLRDHPDLRVEVARIDTVLDALGILPEARPETLDPERFVALADALS